MGISAFLAILHSEKVSISVLGPFFAQENPYAPRHGLHLSGLTIPDDQLFPAGRGQSLYVPGIPRLIALKLRPPVCGIGFWCVRNVAAMRVPETAVNKYHFPPR